MFRKFVNVHTSFFLWKISDLMNRDLGLNSFFLNWELVQVKTIKLHISDEYHIGCRGFTISRKIYERAHFNLLSKIRDLLSRDWVTLLRLVVRASLCLGYSWTCALQFSMKRFMIWWVEIGNVDRLSFEEEEITDLFAKTSLNFANRKEGNNWYIH